LKSVKPVLYSNDHKRIAILDSFRFLAITIVVLFHYYSRWATPEETSLYPYADKYDNAFFQNGFLGVQFFFIISGFVIAFTINGCKSILEFLKRRFIRLFPPMLFCSLLTFVFIKLLDPDKHLLQLHSNAVDLIPSLTFTEPGFFEKIFGLKTDYIDGVYWSLAIEVKFYLIFGILYFINRKSAWKSWCIFVLVIELVWMLIRYYKYEPVFASHDFFNVFSYIFITRYLIYFTMGILFFNLYKDRKFLNNRSNLLLAMFTIALLFATLYITEVMRFKYLMLIIAASILFLMFIYKPTYLSFLNNKFFQLVGLLSYEIYLLHKNIGISLINYIINVFSIGQYQFLVPLVVYGIIAGVSFFIFNYYEKPISRWLRVKLSI